MYSQPFTTWLHTVHDAASINILRYGHNLITGIEERYKEAECPKGFLVASEIKIGENGRCEIHLYFSPAAANELFLQIGEFRPSSSPLSLRGLQVVVGSAADIEYLELSR